MTAGTNRRLLIAGAAAAVLVLGFVMRGEDRPAEAPAPPSNERPAAAPTRADVPVVDVRLEVLKSARGDLAEGSRNPFRFEARVPPPAARPPASRPRTAVDVPPVPAGPPPPPTIPLRFIGLIDAPTRGGRVAILSDGRGNVFYGREGDVIEGRYKVLRIGTDTTEMAYSDGSGRQTIRLSGQ